MSDLDFTYENPPPGRGPTGGGLDYSAIALIAKRAGGRWIKLKKPMGRSVAGYATKKLGPEYEVVGRAATSDDGSKRIHLYIRHIAGQLTAGRS